MDRRNFIEIAASAMAATTLASCAARRAASANTGSLAPINAAAFHAMRQFADTPFGRIAYVERGSGAAALFLHGYPLNGFQWRGAIERLSPFRRCIAADFMGLGYSEVPIEQSITPEAQAYMLAALLDKRSVTSVDIIANDSGGAVAQFFVARFPERVRTLLLTNCDVAGAPTPPTFLKFVALAKAGKLADLGLVPVLENKALARSATGLGTSAYENPAHFTDEAIECYFRPLVATASRKAQFHNYAIALEKIPFEQIEPQLRSSAVPTRIVWGMADTFFSTDDADRLDKLFPKSRGIRKLEGAKLFFPEEMPDVLAAEARQLWGV